MFMTLAKTRVSSLNYLPEDLVIEILSRLPVKSLVRFTRVCKSWHTLIESPRFISMHMKQNHNLDFSYLFATYERCPDTYKFFISRMSLLAVDTLDTPINLGFPFLGEREGRSIIGVCNGLVCITLSSHHEFAFAICNLSTRWYSKIPIFDALQVEKRNPNFTYSYGFAFDSSSNDFKVIKIIRRFVTGRREKAFVYTLTTNSWRDIDMNVPNHDHEYLIIRESTTSAIIKDVIYWEVNTPDNNNLVLLSFNMVDESFRVISGPMGSDWLWIKHYYWKSFQLKEELAIFAYIINNFVVWALDVDSVGWSLRCHVNLVLIHVGVNEVARVKLIGRTEKGDVIIEARSSYGVKRFLYDFDRREAKELDFGEIGAIYRLLEYKESLLPVKKNNQV